MQNTYETLDKEVIGVEQHTGVDVLILKTSDYERHSSNNYKDCHLMNGFFTGTAIIVPDSKKISGVKTVDFNNPHYKGQVLFSEDDSEDDDAAEIAFKYDNVNTSQRQIREVLEAYLKAIYTSSKIKTIYYE